MSRHILVSLALLLGIAACDGTNQDEESTDLDIQLEEALLEAANGNGLAFFTMPASDNFTAIPQDPNNPLTTDKVELGKLLYHETGLLVDNVLPEGRFSSSCASCHHAAAGFRPGRIQGVGEGGSGFGEFGEGRINSSAYTEVELDTQPVTSPSAMNGAYQEVNLWNGQFGATGPNANTQDAWTPDTPKETNILGYEGLETQAIAGLQVHRMGSIENTLAVSDETYTTLFEAAFPGALIDRERVGLAIAAYERTLLSNRAPFQLWLQGNRQSLTEQEKRGALIFFRKAGCVSCHTGPALNSMTFYALGFKNLQGPGVYGEFEAEDAANKGRGGFTGDPQDDYKFKTPQLYNLTDSPFYGHGGSFKSVREVVIYKNQAIAENTTVPASQLAPQFKPLLLTDEEISDLVAFLETGLHDPDLMRYVPESVPSGNCIPVNDAVSRIELGCN